MIENIDPELIASIDPELVVALIMFVSGMIESARRFQATGRIPYTQLPWAAKRELFAWIRKSYFTVDKPENEPSFVVDMTVDEVRESLAKQGFVPEWPLAYVYGGEDLNMAQYIFKPSDRLPHRQIHVRAFDHPDGVEILAHEEPSAIHHPEEHLETANRAHESAHDFVKRRLENEVPIGYPQG